MSYREGGAGQRQDEEEEEREAERRRAHLAAAAERRPRAASAVREVQAHRLRPSDLIELDDAERTVRLCVQSGAPGLRLVSRVGR